VPCKTGYAYRVSRFTFQDSSEAVDRHPSTADPTWGDIFECCFKAQSSELERLFCHVSVKRDVRALSFERAFENVTPGGIGCTCSKHMYMQQANSSVPAHSHCNRPYECEGIRMAQVPRAPALVPAAPTPGNRFHHGVMQHGGKGS